MELTGSAAAAVVQPEPARRANPARVRARPRHHLAARAMIGPITSVDRRADLACQCIDVDQAADGGLEEGGDKQSMSRAILTAQKHGQLDKCRFCLHDV